VKEKRFVKRVEGYMLGNPETKPTSQQWKERNEAREKRRRRGGREEERSPHIYRERKC